MTARAASRESIGAPSHVDAFELQPPQERRGVEQLQRRVRGCGVQPAVVDIERVGVALLVEVEQRQVPVVVEGQAIVGRPVRFTRREPRDAFVDPALHLVHVGDGVDRPDVIGVAVDRGEPVMLGGLVVPALLEPEREHPAHVAVV